MLEKDCNTKRVWWRFIRTTRTQELVDPIFCEDDSIFLGSNSMPEAALVVVGSSRKHNCYQQCDGQLCKPVNATSRFGSKLFDGFEKVALHAQQYFSVAHSNTLQIRLLVHKSMDKQKLGISSNKILLEVSTAHKIMGQVSHRPCRTSHCCFDCCLVFVGIFCIPTFFRRHHRSFVLNGYRFLHGPHLLTFGAAN